MATLNPDQYTGNETHHESLSEEGFRVRRRL